MGLIARCSCVGTESCREGDDAPCQMTAYRSDPARGTVCKRRAQIVRHRNLPEGDDDQLLGIRLRGDACGARRKQDGTEWNVPSLAERARART